MLALTGFDYRLRKRLRDKLGMNYAFCRLLKMGVDPKRLDLIIGALGDTIGHQKEVFNRFWKKAGCLSRSCPRNRAFFP